MAALELGEVDEAREALQLAVNRSPMNSMARFGLGLAEMRSGRPGPGFANLQSALQVANGNPELLRALGSAASAAGQLWLAADALAEAVVLEPGVAAGWTAKAGVHLARGEALKAREAYERALEIDPNDGRVAAALAALETGGP